MWGHRPAGQLHCCASLRYSEPSWQLAGFLRRGGCVILREWPDISHRAILAAQSPVFKAELFGPMAEGTMTRITLHEIEPLVFKALLQFVYTDSLPADRELGDSHTDMIKHLLAAADRYALDRLKLVCAQKLWESVSVDTVADALSCADVYSCQELRSRCIDFIMAEKNFKKTVLTESFMSLMQNFLSILAELRAKVGA